MENTKTIFGLLFAMWICVSAAGSAFATTFTASVEQKSAPTVVTVTDEAGNSAVAMLLGDLPEGLAFVSEDMLVITAVADAETSDKIPEDSEKILMEVFNGLQEGRISVPFAELDQNAADRLVIRDLFDISWADVTGDASEKLLDAEGVSLEITFDLGIAAETKVYVMVYKNHTWMQIEQVINNGDGTVTCLFDHLCPVAVIVEADEVAQTGAFSENRARNTESEDAAAQDMAYWGGIMTAAVLGLVTLFVSRRNSRNKLR